MVEDGHIGVPLDIVDLRIFRHEVVDDGEDEVLHLGIGHVEHELGAATTENRGTLRRLDDPIGVGVVELADTVGHLWLDPDAELDAVLLGIS